MLDDDRPIMDGRWGDESEFQDQKEFNHSMRKTSRPMISRKDVALPLTVYKPRVNMYVSTSKGESGE